MSELKLYPSIEPYETGMLDVGSGHRMYWEQCGRPDGQPVLFLHGGPGSGANDNHRRFFDPHHYRIVLFDQRGAGRSTPIAGIDANTTPDLVADIERLREAMGIERWLVFGGSWGSTLALAYAQAHPGRCTGLVMRGIALFRREDIDWWLYGTRNLFPENWRRFAEHIPAEERDDLLQAYHRRLLDPDPAVHMPAATMWKSYERNLVKLVPEPGGSDLEASPKTLAMSRIMAHYKVNDAFLRENQLVENVDRIRDIPGVIVHGRYDVVCPITGADALSRAWPEADYEIIPAAGHDAMDPATVSALVSATNRFREFR